MIPTITVGTRRDMTSVMASISAQTRGQQLPAPERPPAAAKAPGPRFRGALALPMASGKVPGVMASALVG